LPIIQANDFIELNLNSGLSSLTTGKRMLAQCGENRAGVAQIPPDFGSLRR
jgi:hypothetical protein